MRLLIITTFSINLLSAMSQSACDCYQRLEGLSELQSHEGQNTEALETFKRALTFLPDSVKNYRHDFQLALFYLKSAQLDSATSYLVKSIENNYKIARFPAKWIERKKGQSRFTILKWSLDYLYWYFYAFKIKLYKNEKK